MRYIVHIVHKNVLCFDYNYINILITPVNLVKFYVEENQFTLSEIISILFALIIYYCRSQWPRGPRRGSAAARLLRLWVRIPPGAWMSVVSVVCCQVEVSATS